MHMNVVLVAPMDAIVITDMMCVVHICVLCEEHRRDVCERYPTYRLPGGAGSTVRESQVCGENCRQVKNRKIKTSGPVLGLSRRETFIFDVHLSRIASLASSVNFPPREGHTKYRQGRADSLCVRRPPSVLQCATFQAIFMASIRRCCTLSWTNSTRCLW